MEKQITTPYSEDPPRDDIIMLTAWVQTESSWLQQTDRERGLQRRIDDLEMQLNKVNELARHILINCNTGQQQEQQSQQFQQQKQQTHPDYNHIRNTDSSGTKLNQSNNNNHNNNTNNIDSSHMSVINPLRRPNLPFSESIKYKIVPQGADGVNVEPIDVRLETSSDDLGTDQLNGSDNESGRLVICVPSNNNDDDEEQEGEIKSDIQHVEHYSTNKTTAASDFASSHSNRLFERKNSPDSSTNYNISDTNPTMAALSQHNDARISFTSNNSDEASTSKGNINRNSNGNTRIIHYHKDYSSASPSMGIRVTMPPLQSCNHQIIENNNVQQSRDSNHLSPITLTTVKLSTIPEQQDEQMNVPINYSYSTNIAKVNNGNSSSNTNSNNNYNTSMMIPIGKYGTKILQEDYNKINWDYPAHAIRKLLMSAFGRQTLATHSLTGRPSPAFKGQNKPIKQKLDKFVIEDIIDIVMKNSSMPRKEIRSIITTKCADENKMMKLRLNKRTPMRELTAHNSPVHDDGNNSGN